MFSVLDHEFMTNKMMIVVSSIESKLNEPIFAEYKLMAIEAISKYIEAIKKHESSGLERNLYTSMHSEVEEFIRSHYCQLEERIKNDEVKQVFDALRYTFTGYAHNGLHQVYTRQENECWHPKIKLTEVIMPNDIYSLEPVLTLYRGCDVGEFETGIYGQAWTTSLEVAKEFACKHYQSQAWFDINKRTVLITTYFRQHVLFSNQTQLGEYEVVVDIDKLGHVRKCTQEAMS